MSGPRRARAGEASAGRGRAEDGSRMRRRFGHVRRLPSGRYEASYLDEHGKRHQGETPFLTYGAADQFLATVEADLLRGEWVDPALARVTFSEWSQRWLDGIVHLAPKTLESYQSAISSAASSSTGWTTRLSKSSGTQMRRG